MHPSPPCVSVTYHTLGVQFGVLYIVFDAVVAAHGHVTLALRVLLPELIVLSLHVLILGQQVPVFAPRLDNSNYNNNYL